MQRRRSQSQGEVESREVKKKGGVDSLVFFGIISGSVHFHLL